ncbi:MAG: hypothetical protein ACOCXA_06460 [Planctomycetota bacterium]
MSSLAARLADGIHSQAVETRGKLFFPASRGGDAMSAQFWMLDLQVAGSLGSTGSQGVTKGPQDANGLESD